MPDIGEDGLDGCDSLTVKLSAFAGVNGLAHALARVIRPWFFGFELRHLSTPLGLEVAQALACELAALAVFAPGLEALEALASLAVWSLLNVKRDAHQRHAT
jgi:hypothetical protein